MNDMESVERATCSRPPPRSRPGACRSITAKHALKDVGVDILDKTVTAFIGPSGCGKSTFLRCINRMNDTIDICRVGADRAGRRGYL